MLRSALLHKPACQASGRHSGERSRSGRRCHQEGHKAPAEPALTILLRPGSLEAGTCYSISGPIDLASNVTIDSASPPDRWCMQRATLPTDPNSPSPELPWFSVTGAAVDNFTMRNANLHGLGPGDVSFEKQVSYVDRG